ncbi:class I SAM-dependent methyltransferase [Paenibacillus sp. ACRRX]|uniref:class I SAM-dependent methyltransferase n=1 Tax=Paenibacillus sp. ACRRX TaxID=2918206 RepID=UPI001EF6FE05|nr:class I SAM-dependent methyltransferase [Paenibacillus sp. ACRRX]MCG7410880.1 class I SAM-dependent methyltransferase [Paenibacillus sp. ACRRX]
MNDWNKYCPVFEYEQVDSRVLQHSAWVGHRHFSYDLVRSYQPRLLVELGTHWGASFFSMCQGIKDGNLSTLCYAVDTWVGDPHSGGYDDEVYNNVVSITSSLYPRHATLLRTTFDEALAQFQDASIDLLHIDGFHQYEAVKHDYESWLPKLAPDGIILFHDISVHGFGFGVWKLWSELKEQYPALQFEHSGGLGILFPKGVHHTSKLLLDQWEELKGGYVSM